MVQQRRTDLAIEAQELFESSTQGQTELSGVVAVEKNVDGFSVHRVEVLDEQGAKSLGKPCGIYHTVTTTPFTRREENAFQRGVEVVRQQLAELIPADDRPVLVVGLGNRAITPDALGPLVWGHTLVTRHLVQSVPQHFGDMRPVSALAAGVLGTTGVESGELIGGLVRDTAPACVIAIDALASRSVERLCNTIQISDTGIAPGSGVGNHRFPLTQESLGVPVIAIGVPTVVDGGTLAADLLQLEAPPDLGSALFVTPRDIDRQVEDFAKLIGHAINAALQPSLSLEDLQMLMD